MNGKAGSDNGETSISYQNRIGNPASLLNTPLGNTMKKLGMNPSMSGNSLN